jgi:cation transport ATPase
MMTSEAYRFDAYHVLPDSPQMQQDFLYMIASLEARSEDPNAADVVRVAKINAILPVEVAGFQEFLGRGLGGLVQLPHENHPRAVIMGTREFMAESGLQIPDILEVTARKWEGAEDSQMILAGWDGWVRGVLKFVKDKSDAPELAV